ncbi:MAG TPA: SURF1 family protein [Sphingobium sp.]|nr:SURF1 family protein [Sphingobium sp.]
MRMRLPLLPTLIVASAILAMIALGIWQLHRREEKSAMLALAAANPARPAISFPAMPPVPAELLFRRSSVHCLRVVRWQTEAGRAADGSMGYRYIAHCATGAEGPGLLVALGVDKKPDLQPGWNGGQVRGWVSEEPDHRSLWSRIGGNASPLRPMLIAERPPQGLKPLAPPNVQDVPNNHLAYAVQWFFFAVVAAVIYLLALRRLNPPPPGSS